jgi:methyltransferase (TIGR00027 family)
MKVFSVVVYVVLQVLCLPLAIVGVLLATYRQMVVSKRLGLSQTAIEVIQARWTMDRFGIRADPDTVRLTNVLPNASPVGLWLIFFPLWVKYRLCGDLFLYPTVPAVGSEGFVNFLIARTLYIDRMIRSTVTHVEQVVVLGAGYDMRCYGELKREGLSCFEVDQPTVQQHKRANLKHAGINTSHVTFVEVDFRQDEVFSKLCENGYDIGKRTLFLWEGVTLYLSESDVRKMLRGIRTHAPSGSVLVADFYDLEKMFARAKSSKATANKALKYTGEEAGFSLSFGDDCDQALNRFLNSEDLTAGNTYFLGKMSKHGPFVVVSEVRL